MFNSASHKLRNKKNHILCKIIISLCNLINKNMIKVMVAVHSHTIKVKLSRLQPIVGYKVAQIPVFLSCRLPNRLCRTPQMSHGSCFWHYIKYGLRGQTYKPCKLCGPIHCKKKKKKYAYYGRLQFWTKPQH